MTAVVESSPFVRKANSPWWMCPSTRELSLRAKISMGYSTVAGRLSKNKHAPVLGPNIYEITMQEINTIKAVLARAEAMDSINQIRAGSLIMEYEQLKQSCRGDGTLTCVLCGYDPINNEKKLQTKKCDKCGKIACSTCFQMKKLHSGTHLVLCKLCFDYQELWCKTGAWMMNRLPKQFATEDEIEEWRMKRATPRPSVDVVGLLGGQDIHLDQDYFTHDEDEESGEDHEKSNTLSSYSNVKFLDEGETSDVCCSPSPVPGLALLSDMTERSSLSLPSQHKRSSLSPEPRRLTAVTADNRDKFAEIRDRIAKQRALDGSPSSSLKSPHPNIQTTKSFDSSDSEFEPVKVHQSLEMDDEEEELVLQLPESSPLLKDLSEKEENGENSTRENSLHSESEEMSENSDFEYDDQELPRTMSFLRFGATRAPIRTERKESSEDKPDQNTEEEEETEKGDNATKTKEVYGKEDLGEEETPDISQILGENKEEPVHEEETIVKETATEEKWKWEEKKEELVFVEKQEVEEEEELVTDSDKPKIISDSTTAATNDPKEDSFDKEQSPSSPSSLTSNSPKKTRRLTILTSSGENTSHKENSEGGYRWKRRNATRTTPSGEPKATSTSSNNEGGSSMSKDQNLLSKREKARLAAKRVREGRRVLSNSRKKEEDKDDADILEFVPSPTHTVSFEGDDEQLI